MAENADEAANAAMAMGTPMPVERMWQSMVAATMENAAPETKRMARHLFFAGAIGMLRLFDSLGGLEEEEAIERLVKIREELSLYKTMVSAEVREEKAKAARG